MRLRDLPGLAAAADKVYQQFKGYADRLQPRHKPGNPYTHAGKKKRKRLKWD